MIEHARVAVAMQPNILPETKPVLKFFDSIRSIFPAFRGELTKKHRPALGGETVMEDLLAQFAIWLSSN